MKLDEALQLRAKDLKPLFGVYGYFYNIDIDGTTYPCRSILELVSHDITPLVLNELLEHTPDAYCIMMNPGSSKPVDSGYKIQHANTASDIYKQRELVKAVPDTTQYQILKISAAAGWNHVRIINISDLREPKSPRFLEMIKMLADIESGGVHSIFSDTRKNELEKIYNNKAAPVILGWGRDEGLLPLAKQCRSKLNINKAVGIPANEDGTLYAHPSPMLQAKKNEFLSEIIEQIIRLK